MSSVTETKPVFAELSEDGQFIEIYFRPSPKWVEVMRSLSGCKFMPKDKLPDGVEPHWRLAVDFFAAKDLSEAVGKDNLELGEALSDWAWSVRDLEEDVRKILAAEDWKLERLPKVLPDLNKFMRSYQRCVAAYVAATENSLNASQPGLGKSIETIAGIYEAGTEDGPNLIVAPKTSLEPVWEYELAKHQPLPVIRASGEGLGRRYRLHALREAELAIEMGKAVWVLVNPEMVRFRKHSKEQGVAQDNLYSAFDFLHEAEWNNIVIDEVHKNGMRNTLSVTAKGMLALKTVEGGKKIGLSGTPVGGKPINLFGILHWLYPEQFPSKYKWAERWLEIDRDRYGTVVGDVKEGKDEEFRRHLAPIMIRHTKADKLKDLPEKDIQELWVSMTDKQAEQYERFREMAEIELGDDTLTATSVLAIYTRLKQFANAVQEFEDGNLVPTADSGKLNLVLEKLEELGIKGLVPADEASDAQAIIASQFERFARLIYDVLVKKGVPCVLITGTQKGKTESMASFQGGEARVCIIQTDTGGLSITLDKADTVFIMDEKWNPDDQEQVEDRAHRASRMHQVTVYYVRSKDSIDEYIRMVTGLKGTINKKILSTKDLRTKLIGAKKGEDRKKVASSKRKVRRVAAKAATK